MAYEQTVHSISLPVKSTATVLAGYAVNIQTDGTVAPGASAAQGFVTGILLEDVNTTSGNNKQGSIAIPNGAAVKVVAANAYTTPTAGDYVSFDTSGNCIAYTNGSGHRCWGTVLVGGVANGIITIQFMPTVPVSFTA